MGLPQDLRWRAVYLVWYDGESFDSAARPCAEPHFYLLTYGCGLLGIVYLYFTLLFARGPTPRTPRLILAAPPRRF